MRIVFLSEDDLDRLYNTGKLSKVYEFDQEESSEEFSEEEFKKAQNLEAAVDSKIASGELEAYYDSWGDKTTRATISVSLIGDDFVDVCLDFISTDEDRCIFCLVVEDLKRSEYAYHGRFVIVKGCIYVEDAIADIWRIRTVRYNK